MDRTGGVGVRRIGWVLGVVVAAGCGGSASNGSRVSSASTSSQECTTSTAEPLPLSELKYDARPNPPVNLLQNGDVEAGSGSSPAVWRIDVNPPGSTLTWDTGRVLSGTRALLVTTTAPGRAAWAQDVGAVEAGLRYRLRANVFASTAGSGTHALEVFWLDGGGNQVGRDALQSTTAGQWFEVDGFVTAPANAAKATVAAAALAPGQYSFDDVMLVTAEPDPIPIAGRFPLGFWSGPTPGLLKNGDFAVQGAPGAPLAWQRSLAAGDATFRWTGDGSPTPATLEINASSDCDASWFQVVDVEPGRTYQVQASIWATTTAPRAADVEVTWRDSSGNPLSNASASATSSSTWSDARSPAVRAPAAAATAVVAFRVRHSGTYRVRSIQLVSASGAPPIFDPKAAGFGFSLDERSSIPRAYAVAPYASYEGLRAVDNSNAQSITAAAADPTMALWFAGDEVAWQDPPVPPDLVTASYGAIEAVGRPANAFPVWLNHAPRGSRAQPDNYGVLLPYAQGADILSIDVYPVPAVGHAALPNEGPWSVGEYVDILRRYGASWSGAQRRVMWMVLQGFDWWEDPLSNPGGDHALLVQWIDGSGNVLRADAVGADRTNDWREVALDGLIPPSGTARAVVKIGAYRKGSYAFDGIVLAEQGGGGIVTGGPITFAEAAPRGESVVGQASVDAGRRYTLRGRILAQTRPTYDQSRFMAWDAIVHGARGLTWFGFQYMGEGDQFLREISEIALELASMSGPLLARTSLRLIQSTDDRIEGALFTGSDGSLLVLANRTSSSLSAMVRVSGVPSDHVFRFGTQCDVALGGNTLLDDFDPLAVRLYVLR
mgnify:CR=1 FL=1